MEIEVIGPDEIAIEVLTGYGVPITVNTGGGTGSLTVREVDGTPSATATELVFPNGTVAIASGVATITGLTGATGATGAAATIGVGTVTTGAAGSSAAVTNAGTSSAAVFNFTIPRGDTGATGSTGAAGRTILSGTAPPSSGVGVDGDYFIDAVGWTIYGPKTAGAWSNSTDLIGADGVGIPPGGITGQVLAKTSGTDYATGWVTPSAGSGSLTVREVDGTPSAAATELVFPNGTVSIASGVATITGLTGAAGAAATIAVGTVTTGAAGSSAAVTNVGTSSAAVFNFTIPRGDAGTGGGELIVGEIDGTPDAPVTQLLFPNGTVAIDGGTATITGLTGATGAAGAAATIGVGTVTTGAAGSSAAVTNAGTSSAAVFNFTIPRGDTGATGSTGAAGQGVPTGGTTGQVLAKTSGTDYATNWVTLSGGSSGPRQEYPFFTAATAFMTRRGSSAATMALIANRLYHVPIIISETRTYTQIAIVVTAAVASSTIRLGIRAADQSTAEPTTILVDAGTVDSSSTGTKIITGLTAELTPGLWYLEVLPTHGSTVTTWNQPVAVLGSTMSGTATAAILQLVRDGVTGSLPSTEVGETQTISTTGALIVGIR